MKNFFKPGGCTHGKQKSRCIECNGSAICRHKMQTRFCVECKGAAICKHGKRKYWCGQCEKEKGEKEKEEKGSSSGGSKTRKSKKSYRNVKMSFRKNKKVVAHKKTKRLVKSSSKASSRKSHI